MCNRCRPSRLALVNVDGVDYPERLWDEVWFQARELGAPIPVPGTLTDEEDTKISSLDALSDRCAPLHRHNDSFGELGTEHKGLHFGGIQYHARLSDAIQDGIIL